MADVMILSSSNPLDHVVSHEVGRIGSVPVSNHMIMVVLAGVLMLITFLTISRSWRLVPSGVGNFFEAICVYFRDEVARPILHEHTDRFIGFIWTIFFFILFCNLLGMVPVASIVYFLSLGRLKEIGGTPTSNIYVTGALATFTFAMIHASGIWNNVLHQRHSGRPWHSAAIVGFFVYWYKMVPHIGGVVGVLLFPLLFVLEFLGVVVKSFALAMRLFANMLAGHTVLAVLLLFVSMCKTLGMGLFVAGVSIMGSVALSCLELFVAFLQAYIFTFLATVFIGMAVHQEH